MEISFPNHLPLPFFFLKEIYKEKGFLFPSPSSYSFVKKSERLKSMCAMCAMSTIGFIEEAPKPPVDVGGKEVCKMQTA